MFDFVRFKIKKFFYRFPLCHKGVVCRFGLHRFALLFLLVGVFSFSGVSGHYTSLAAVGADSTDAMEKADNPRDKAAHNSAAAFKTGTVQWIIPQAFNGFVLNGEGKTLRLSAVKDAAGKGLLITPVLGQEKQNIVRLSPAHNSKAFLNIQNGTLEFAEIDTEWASGQWVVQKSAEGTRFINLWKPGLALGVKPLNQGQDVSNGGGASLHIMPVTHEGTLWQLTSAEKSAVGTQGAQHQAWTGTADSTSPHLLMAADLKDALTSVLKMQSLDKIQQKLGQGSDDKEGKEGFLTVENIEENVFRLRMQANMQNAGGQDLNPAQFKVLNIQRGVLEVSSLSADWWSGQWLAVMRSKQSKGVQLQNRWKPNYILARDDKGAVIILDQQQIKAQKHQTEWQILTLNDWPTAIKQVQNQPKKEQSIDSQIADQTVLLATALKNKESQSKKSKKSKKTQTLRGAISNQLKQSVVAQSKPRLLRPQNLGRKKVASPVKPVKPVLPKRQKRQNTIPNLRSNAQPSQPQQAKPVAKKETILSRIHGEFVFNNGNSEPVGPWQTYLKIYAHDLFNQGETLWLIGDGFSFGEELRALRAGFNLPFGKQSAWNFRYNIHLPDIEPTPLNNEYQSLAISEREHNFEIYRVSKTKGHRNETGIFYNHLDSEQLKLELGEQVARDLSFASRDIGLFSNGNLWRENEHTKESGSYRLSLSKGIDVFNATKDFAVRTEAKALPLVFKGHGHLRRDWKESRWHLAGSLGFQYSDRASEWHKHFALGGLNFASGFPAAEVGAEVGVAGSLEVGKSFELAPAFTGLAQTITSTPYARFDMGLANSLDDAGDDASGYIRDAFLTSLTFGLRFKAPSWNLDISYGLPISGESRFSNASTGRLGIAGAVRW